VYQGRTTTTISAPSSAPMDLNSGKPDWRDLGPLMGLVFILVLPTLMGGALIVGNWPHEGSSGWSALWLGGGIVLVVVFGSFIWMLRGAISYEITSYQSRKDDWHYVTLEKYQAGDGLITAHQVSEWVYTESDMRHVALAALWLIIAQPKSLSIERLTKGPMLINVGHRSYKMMDMSQDGAANFLNLLARAGVINGRGPRAAGTIAIVDPRTAALKVLAEASRNPAMLASEGE
jgi:hypothetical protein